MEHEQMSYWDAAKWLARKYGVPYNERELTESEKALQNERESLFITNQFALDFFKDTLLNTDKGRAIGLAYFRKRGFRDFPATGLVYQSVKVMVFSPQLLNSK